MKIRAYIVERRWFLMVFLFQMIITASIIFLDNYQLIYNQTFRYLLQLQVIFCCIILVFDYFYIRRKFLICKNIDKYKLEVSFSPIENAIYELYDSQYKTYRIQENDMYFKEKEYLDFIVRWSHDIKTPIAAMKMLISTSNQESYELQRELFSIQQYVQKVLYYAKTKGYEETFNLSAYSVTQIISDSLKPFSSFFFSKKLTLEYQPMDKVVFTDDKWLSFIFSQILFNSIQHSLKNERIKVKVYEEEKNTIIAIENIGDYISKNHLKYIFDRGYTSSKSNLYATGYGLYLCKTMAEKLGHDVIVSSEKINNENMGIISFKIALPSYKSVR